jgi:hypothetical protein
MMQSKKHPQKCARECRMQQGRHEEKPTPCQRAVVGEKVVPSERKPGHRSTVTTQSKTPHALAFRFPVHPKTHNLETEGEK